ncbi:solute carrier organic anion transporter family member 6A1 [Equus quagga]|uniref:solute carrier organic anion transporter family member 6A1 n=1 Tax=Equus quagga TaxID=89248 RepID=UPI001EE38EA3|nr:solute carrier organic anion transporter family member 6A1 [Equus quagga]
MIEGYSPAALVCMPYGILQDFQDFHRVGKALGQLLEARHCQHHVIQSKSLADGQIEGWNQRRTVPSGGSGCKRPWWPPPPRCRSPAGFSVGAGGAGRTSPGDSRPGRQPSVSPDPSLGRPPGDMDKALVDAEPKAAQAQRPESTTPRESRKAKKRPQRLLTVPASLIKLRSFSKEGNEVEAPLPARKKRRERKESSEGSCGWGCVVIPICQRFNNIYCFLIFYCILVTSQGIVFGLIDLSIDSFEKDNQLKTIESLMLSLGYDISSCLVVVFVAYYGGRGKILRWITASSFLIGFGSLLFAFPYFSGEKLPLNVETEDICQKMKIIRTCGKTSSSFKSKYVSFFILGQFVQGIAGIPLYVLGVVFLENNVAAHSSGTYLGILEASEIFGYALSYATGASVIKASKNSTSEENVEDSRDNLYWLKTWWIHFVFVSLIAWSALIPLSCFPNNVRGTAKIKAGKRKQPKDQEFGTSIKDLFATVWVLMKNSVLVCLSLSRASDSLVMIGVSEFLPIYIENQFMLTRSDATTLAGLVLIPAGAVGHLLGGVIVSKLQMSYKGLMKFMIVTSAISLVLLAFIIFIRCDPIPFAGISEDYGGTGQLGNLTAPCNSHCGCSSTVYSAICGRDDIGYFSPCFAGCTNFKALGNQKAYYNCSCIKEGLTTSDGQGDFIDARRGTCDAKCYKLPLFIVFVFSTIVFAAFSGVPNILAIVRIVSDKQRAMALGMAYVILRIFGSIPGPLVFKIIRETSCIFRDVGRCGNLGSCWIYNRTKMAYLLVGVCFLCKVFTIFFTAIALRLQKHLPKENSEILPTLVKHLKVKKREKSDL